MSDEVVSKYRKKSDSIEIQFSLDNYILLPESKIKCNIFLIPKHDIKLGKSDKEIIIKLTQFEKCEYKNKLQDEESSKLKENLIQTTSSVKHLLENISKKIKFKDIEFEIPPLGYNNLLPTFEFRKNEKNLFVRHLLTVEIPDLEISESIGVIICKLPKKNIKNEKNDTNIFKDENINTYFGLKNSGKISYNISIKKLIFNPNEEIPIKICINTTDLKDIKIELVEIYLQKKIVIYGLLLNTEEKIIMNKKEFKNNQKIIKLSQSLQMENKDIPELTDKEIEKYTNFDEDFLERDDNRTQLNPNMEGNLFKCEYKVKINLIFNNYYKKSINEEFLIDMYDIYNLNTDSIPNYLKHIFLIKENEYFDSENSSSSDDKQIDENKTNESDDFIIYEHKDFRSIIQGKKGK